MHRLLALPDGNFTTPLLWEVMFAPALCEKYFFYTLFRLDERLGGIGYRTLQWIARKGIHSESSVHATSLQTPEEDFITLLPFGGCFLTVIACPDSEYIWQLGNFADHLPLHDQKRLLKIYRGMIVRHLCFRGADKHYLSKNPSFTGWVDGLRRTFPDARFVGLRRDPVTVVASQLSSLESGFEFFGHRITPEISLRFVKMLARYWHLLESNRARFCQDEYQLIEYQSLTADSLNCVTRTLAQLGYEVSPTYIEALTAACSHATNYRSGHQYSLDEYHLTSEHVLADFKHELSVTNNQPMSSI